MSRSPQAEGPAPAVAGSTLRYVGSLLLRHRIASAVTFLGSLLAAVFEGTTLGIFALAVRSLTAEADSAPAGEMGRLGVIADGWRESLGPEGFFLTMVVAAIVTQLLRSGLGFAGSVAAAHLQANVEGEVRRRLFDQFMRVSYSETRRSQTGALSSHLDQVQFLGYTINRGNMLLSQFLLLLTYIVVLMWLSVPATLVAAASMVVIVLWLRRFVIKAHRAADRLKDAQISLARHSIEFLTGLKVVLSFGREQFASDKVGAEIRRGVEASRRSTIWKSSLSPLVDSVAIIGIGLALLAGYFVLGPRDQADLARFATFLFVLFRLTPRLSVLNKNWAALNTYLPFVDRVISFLQQDKQYARVGGRPFRRLEQGIEFQQVALRYPGRSAWAVEQIDFRLERGRRLALVGESGAGKSTIVDLLLGLYEPTAGQVLIDGVDLREWEWGSWRERLGVVSQATFLFHATIAENLAFGRPDASREEIVEAAKAAHADEFIRRLPEGYDTLVGEQGYRLSGGQRQRLAIARAVIRDPDLLILDEATSDLDSRSESLVRDSLVQLASRRTVVTVAHRLSTILEADEILVLDGGRIVERGGHRDLLAREGTYAQLWRLQSDGDRRASPREAASPR